MVKGKNKKNAKQNNTSKQLQSVNINLSETMSAEEIQHIISGAIIEAEEIKAKKEEELRKIDLAKLRDTLGYKEYENKYKNVLNEIKVFFKILFMHKKDIEGDRASTILLKSFVLFFFWIMKWFSLALAILLIVCMPIQYFVGDTNQFLWQPYTYCILFAFLIFVFSRLFRMAGIEIDKLDDRNYLLGLFTSITSLIAVIVAVIALIKGI